MKEVKIPFKGWDLIAWINEKEGDHRVAVKPISEAIGVDWKTQLRKIENDKRFSYGHMTTTGSDGKQYEMVCLPVRQINIWLCGINPSKVKPELREKLISFQEECSFILYEALSGTANRHVVEVLTTMVKELQAMVAHLHRQNEKLREDIKRHDRMLGIEASMAGKRLQAHRTLKLVN